MPRNYALYKFARGKGLRYMPPFPHMKPVEVEIMQRFIELAPLGTEYEYDVRLFPEIKPLAPGADEEAYKAWLLLKAKRIDAVAHTPDAIWILEVKDRLRPSAVGQLLVYRDLYDRQFHPLKPLRLGVVCGDDDPLVRPTCAEHGIKVWVVGPPSAPKRVLG
ncbi:MAG: hypothetical protein JRD89_04840 [Deltaproteobacteria bacterium]|nr:hypothetical protein [Deltaproteobacteria bacterium]